MPATEPYPVLNAVVGRYLGRSVVRHDRRPALGMLGACCAMLLLPHLPDMLDGLIAVAFTAIAAARFAATMAAGPHPLTDRPRPANDNPFRPVLPPHLLRC